jgi:integrase/recombinase XerD
LVKYSVITGIKVPPYALRHTAAITMLKNNANAFHVQTMLGHTNLNTTKIYINLASSDLQEIHKETSPLNKVI